MEITKELLQGYRSKKDEILELDYILKNRWRDEGLIGLVRISVWDLGLELSVRKNA